MIMAEKLVKSFGVYFIIFGCITFIYNFATLINNILIVTGKGALYGSSTLQVMDWVIPGISFIGAILLFLAGLSVVRLKDNSVMMVLIASLTFMLKQILNLSEDIRAIIQSSPDSGYSGLLGYGVAFSISLHFFSLLFWVFVVIYFNRHAVKSLLKN